MAPLTKRRLLKALLSLGLLMVAMMFITEAWARPGGGSSYSGGGGGGGGGGGSSGGGGGGGGGGEVDLETLFYIIYYIVMYPHISLPIIGGIALFWWLDERRKPKTGMVSNDRLRGKIKEQQRVTEVLRNFRRDDPQFSRILFLDFAHLLYHQFHHWRSKPEFDNLAPYLSPYIMNKTREVNKKQVAVSEVVVGAADIVRLYSEEHHEVIIVRFDANFTETSGNKSYRIWQEDQWIFRRRKNVISPGPEKMTHLGCPNCGSTLEVKPDGSCGHCGKVVEPGDQQWQLHNIIPMGRESRKGEKFGAYAAEQGTNLVTVVDRYLEEEKNKMTLRMMGTSWNTWFATFQERIVKPYIRAIYESYQERNWEKARPLMSDNLFRAHYYWVNAYKDAGLVNHLENLKINYTEPARLETDHFYESITVRFQASVVDYLKREKDGSIVGGSKKPRLFTEYWTFIRRTGVEKDENNVRTSNCQNCGAPVSIGMAGVCNHCQAKVTTGDFGWVLAVITQDEVYVG